MMAPGYDDAETDLCWMKEFGCMEIVQEDFRSNEKSHFVWDSLMARIQFGDTIVIPKFSNALRGARQLVFFLESCQIKHIRLVSLHDRIQQPEFRIPGTERCQCGT